MLVRLSNIIWQEKRQKDDNTGWEQIEPQLMNEMSENRETIRMGRFFDCSIRLETHERKGSGQENEIICDEEEGPCAGSGIRKNGLRFS